MTAALASDAQYWRTIAGTILLIAAILKMTNPHDFQRFVGLLGVPTDRLRLTTRFVITVEFAVGALLVLGVAPDLLAATAVLLGVVFLVAQLLLSRREIKATCGCFGSADVEVDVRLDVMRAMTYLLIACAALASSADNGIGRANELATWSSLVAGGLGGSSFVMGFLLVGTVRSFQRWRPGTEYELSVDMRP